MPRTCDRVTAPAGCARLTLDEEGIMPPASVRQPMTADEFIAWAMEQPEGERYELERGQIVGMAPERLAHARVKGAAFVALRDAIRAAGLPCEALPDGVSVEIDETTVYEPDALVRCGPELPPDTVRIKDPLILVEVLSPSTKALDAGAKLADYFSLASVRHYLILKTGARTVIHHERDRTGEIATRILTGGALHLDPPGIIVQIESLFA